jgi:hypothetical protein
MQFDVFEWSGAVDELGVELAREILTSWRRQGWELVGALIDGRGADEQWWIFARADENDISTDGRWPELAQPEQPRVPGLRLWNRP